MKAVMAVLGCFGILAFALVGIVVLAFLATAYVPSATGPEPAPGEPAPTAEPTPDPDVYVRHVDSINAFTREEAPDRYRIQTRFIDYGGQARSLTCEVSRQDLEREVGRYGLTSKRWAEVKRRIQAALDAEVKKRGLEPYFEARAGDKGSWSWSWRVPGETEREEYDRAVREAHRLDRYLEKEFDDVADAIQDKVLRQWGLRVDRDFIRVDHAGVVERSTEPLASCATALLGLARGGSLRQAFGIMLAFFQELRYELPPDEKGREIVGLWVPPEVLVRGAGDCDSKSLALCAAWRRTPSRSIVVLVPKHALVGFEAKPGPDERFVRLGNRYFVLAEPAGPGKLAPGVTDMQGDFEYVMFEPLVGAAAAR